MEKERVCLRAELEVMQKERACLHAELETIFARHREEIKDKDKETARYCLQLETQHASQNVELQTQRQLVVLQLRDYKAALVLSCLFFLTYIVAFYFNIGHEKDVRFKLQ